MRVLHALDCFLSTTEDWIYPQVTVVTGVTTAILCRKLVNLDTYPADRPLFLQRPEEASANRFTLPPHKVLAKYYVQQTLAAWQEKHSSSSIIHVHYGWIGDQNIKLQLVLDVQMITSFYRWEA